MDTQSPVRLLQLARLLRLPAAWLKAEARAGRIPYLRAGRLTLFDPEAVRHVLAERAARGEEVPRD